MEQSILTSTKKVLHIGPDDNTFDLDVLTFINSAFSTLHDLGVGPDDGFATVDDTDVWNDFLDGTDNLVQQNQIKTFILLTTRLMFDPPNSSYLMAAMEKQIEELTWRINVRRENAMWVDADPESELVVDGGTPEDDD